MVDQALRHGYTWGVDADITAFFDTVDQDTLLTALNEEVADGSVLRLIRFILEAGVVLPSASENEPTEEGTPQGDRCRPCLPTSTCTPWTVQLRRRALDWYATPTPCALSQFAKSLSQRGEVQKNDLWVNGLPGGESQTEQ